MNKLDFIRFLKKLDLRALIFGVGISLITVLAAAGFVKISATGGMAKAQKEAEIAYEVASEKELNKDKGSKEEKTTKKTDSDKTTSSKSDDVSSDSDETTEREVSASEEMINEHFGKSVFVGDSVMLGFSNYHDVLPEGFWGEPYFLVAGSFAVRTALEPVTNDSTHPLYMGQRMLVEDAISLMTDVENVYLFFGLNDIGATGVEETFNNYVKVINNILMKRSDVKINIISTTYMLYGSELEVLNNANIAKLNTMLKDYCDRSGHNYIDIANLLGNETTGLEAQYCSDEYVHQTQEAYDVWIEVLEDSIS